MSDRDSDRREIARLRSELARLEAENRRLAEVDRRKDSFLAVLSNELRNPLAPIRNSSEALHRAAPGSEQAQRALDVIDRQVGQLARLVDDLLDMIRVSRGKIELRRERLELNELVRCTLADHRPEFEAGHVTLVVDISPRPLYVEGDRNRLTQVVGNLLHNAIKFTAPGGRAAVAVDHDEGTNGAVLRVADNGRGMTSEVLASLFQPFVQAERGDEPDRDGLGLGLALVKGLVEHHGGEVSAHSAGLGQGAELIVRLPLSDGPAPAEQLPTAPARVPRRVLIIEDNLDAATSLRFVLELDDHQIEVAGDGAEGIARARQFKPDVVLCDIGLPDMNGYDVARAFRADDALAQTFMVALSGYASPEDRTRAAQAGFDEHLAKPVTIESIEEMLARAIERPRR
ncbi:MAG TPA: ATP-binding protein [Kofleriaceae bacterium]|nr:ATP-binding protein [Kofleriaceae bacterium]